MQIITGIVKPMSTLIITRRLYNIVSLRSVDPPSNAAVRCIKLLQPLCKVSSRLVAEAKRSCDRVDTGPGDPCFSRWPPL